MVRLSFVLIIVKQTKAISLRKSLDCSQSSLFFCKTVVVVRVAIRAAILVSNVPSLAWGWGWKQSARSWRSYGKIEDCEQSGKVSSRQRFRFWLPWTELVRSYKNLFRLPITLFIPAFLNNRELKIRRRQRQRKQPCTCITLFCTFLCRRSRLQRESAQFHVSWRTGLQDSNFFFSFPERWFSPLESTPKKFTSIWQIKRDRISVIKFKAASIHFLTDVFVAVVVVWSFSP